MNPSKATVVLLDVNVLLAFAVIGHTDHAKVYQWFKSSATKGFRTCAITQSGFVRLLSNPSMYSGRVSSINTLDALRDLTSRQEHRFWPMDIDYLSATAPLQSRISGYKQITDAYLLGLAIHHKGRLATLNRAVLHLAGEEFRDAVELIG